MEANMVMKIVHIVLGKANPDRLNGVNKAVHELASEMIRGGKDIEVWGLTTTPAEKTFKRTYPLHLFDCDGRSFVLSPLLMEAIDALPQNSCVHFHGGLIPIFYKMAVALHKRRIPWVLTPHGAYMSQSLTRNYWFKAAYLCLMESFILKNARAIHVYTEAEKQAVIRWSNKVPVAVIQNGHSGIIVYNNDGFRRLYHRARPVFGFIGRLDQIHKGLDLLLEAFAIYVAQKGKGELWLVGDGPHRRLLHKRVKKLNLGRRVRFWGPRFGEEKVNLLRNMDVFVHTSRWEGMPMSVLEAGSYGLPLLVSVGTGIAETVTKWQAGYALETNTPPAIASALVACEKAYNTSDLTVKSRNVRQMIEKEFNWPVVIDHLQKSVYQAA
jgi:glycosyltransferase involved in cell wall biosynthesis